MIVVHEGNQVDEVSVDEFRGRHHLVPGLVDALLARDVATVAPRLGGEGAAVDRVLLEQREVEVVVAAALDAVGAEGALRAARHDGVVLLPQLLVAPVMRLRHAVLRRRVRHRAGRSRRRHRRLELVMVRRHVRGGDTVPVDAPPLAVVVVLLLLRVLLLR